MMIMMMTIIMMGHECERRQTGRRPMGKGLRKGKDTEG
jgi:hypothetical protein